MRKIRHSDKVISRTPSENKSLSLSVACFTPMELERLLFIAEIPEKHERERRK